MSRVTGRARPFGPLLPLDNDPHLLRGVTYCGGGSADMTSTADTIEDATEVPRANVRRLRRQGIAAA